METGNTAKTFEDGEEIFNVKGYGFSFRVTTHFMGIEAHIRML